MEPVISKNVTSIGHAVLVVDRSASMTAISQISAQDGDANKDETNFQLAIRSAISWIEEQPKNRPISIITTGALPETIASRVKDHTLLKRELEALSPHYGYADNTAALSLADSLHHSDAKNGTTVLFTDGKWVDVKEANALTLHRPIEMVKLGKDESTNNGAILSFGIKSDRANADLNQAIVTIRNDGNKEQNYSVEIYANEGEKGSNKVAELSVKAAPGEWQSVQASGLPYADFYKAQLLPTSDGIQTDNVAYQFPTVERARKVLLVTDGNMFLEKALILAGIQPVKMSPESAPPRGGNIDWILLDGVNHSLWADKEWTKLLEAKPLWIIDHPEEGATTSAVPAHSNIEIKDHPVTSYISFQDTHIGRFHLPGIEATSWGEAVITYGEVPAIFAGTIGGNPRLRFTFKLQETDLPLRPEFPVLIVQAAEWMNGSTLQQLGTATAGEWIDIPLLAETATAEWEEVEWLGSGISQENDLLSTNKQLEQNSDHLYEVPPIPGLYRLIERDANKQQLSSRYLSVTANAVELMPALDSDDQLRLSSVASTTDNGNITTEDVGSNKSSKPLVHHSLQLWAALLILIIMSVEWGVYRRGHSS
nr:VWA domain-containing protein [Paenibacillus sp. GSMTC-2017]